MPETSPSISPEVWGGIECTINRVQDTYYDQLFYTGFYGHEEARINQIAGLGIKKLRFPVLWEKHQPQKSRKADFQETIKTIASIHAHGMEPIMTLLHHGSGPEYTSLIDPEFPFLFANYAAQVASEFPDNVFYTLINEPLTTARFCGLYGIWFPHLTDEKAFYSMLLNELHAIGLAMKEILKVNPAAKFIQTEDLGKTYAEKALQYQADFENERRWMTYDFLSGNFYPELPLYKRMLEVGIKEDQIEKVKSALGHTDIFGFNYYATSERYLDNRFELYHGIGVGGNGKDAYVDVEAFRINHGQPQGLKVLLTEASDRYPDYPMAITEIHLGAHREEQLRWFDRTIAIANELISEGKNLVAITAWSIFGSCGWQKLLSGPPFKYEPGIFDTRTDPPRETALANLWRNLSDKKHLYADIISEKGWWERSDRFLHQPEKHLLSTDYRPILITGKNGTLAKAFARMCELRGLHYVALDRKELELCDQKNVSDVLDNFRPWIVINTAGYVRVDDAEKEREKCMADNYFGAVNLAKRCVERNVGFISFSSDLVFDGKKNSHYLEGDSASPINVYGQSKTLAEKEILAVHPEALIIRTSAFFSPWDSYNFLYYVNSNLQKGNAIKIPHDQIVSPTYVPDLVNAVLDLIIDGEKGIWHLSNNDEISWADFATLVADKNNLNSELIIRTETAELNQSARRPLYSALSSSRGILLPDLEDAVNRYLKDVRL